MLYCDYGNRDEVTRSELYEIPRSLANPPRQSVLCALTQIAPPSGGWASSVAEIFEQVVSNKLLFAGLADTVDGKCEVRNANVYLLLYYIACLSFLSYG